jgi:hypothetical protein
MQLSKFEEIKDHDVFKSSVWRRLMCIQMYSTFVLEKDGFSPKRRQNCLNLQALSSSLESILPLDSCKNLTSSVYICI